VKIIEKMGKYVRTMDAGLNFKIPLLEQVAYAHSLKE
jgi:regulator of protease activity HflC (stomatin/prohibitin superfamily)